MELLLLKQLGVTRWLRNLLILMKCYPSFPLKLIGFPNNWQKLPIWQ